MWDKLKFPEKVFQQTDNRLNKMRRSLFNLLGLVESVTKVVTGCLGIVMTNEIQTIDGGQKDAFLKRANLKKKMHPSTIDVNDGC